MTTTETKLNLLQYATPSVSPHHALHIKQEIDVSSDNITLTANRASCCRINLPHVKLETNDNSDLISDHTPLSNGENKRIGSIKREGVVAEDGFCSRKINSAYLKSSHELSKKVRHKGIRKRLNGKRKMNSCLMKREPMNNVNNTVNNSLKRENTNDELRRNDYQENESSNSVNCENLSSSQDVELEEEAITIVDEIGDINNDDSDQGDGEAVVDAPVHDDGEVLGQCVTSRVINGSRERPYRCDVCRRVLKSAAGLLRHLQTHLNERSWRCDQCDKTYKSSSSLSGHLKTCHSNLRPFVCTVCSKSFPRHNSLKRHNMTHTGEKPFACHVCGKGFPQNAYLKAHMRNHTGEKPYRCNDCGERFKHSGYLIDHRRRIHTGEKRHECARCGKLFTRASDRLRHERTHSEHREGMVRPFKCQACGIRFKFEEKLDRHTASGLCRRGFQMDRAKPTVGKPKIKIQTAASTSGRKQLKPKRFNLKDQDAESIQSDSSLTASFNLRRSQRIKSNS